MTAIITGAGSGIGRATARRLAADAIAREDSDGALLLVDVAEDGLLGVAGEISALGLAVHTLVADLSRPDAGEQVARAAQALGRVDALISNAGVLLPGLLKDLSIADYERTFAVNTRATWLLAKALYHRLGESRGCIVATASLSAQEPSSALGAYSASKAALVMLVRQLAYEWGPDGIRCNCVSPGTTHTAMTDGFLADPVHRAERAAHVPLRRVADPQDIASAIAFLAGPDAAYVSGQDLVVDGGLQTVLMPAIRGLKQT